MVTFVVVSASRESSEAAPPYVELRRMGWNDWWAYRTMFYAVYVSDTGERVELGTVKIADTNLDYTVDVPQEGTQTPLEGVFTELPEGYASIGQDESYYTNLWATLPNQAKDYLQALGDLAASPDRLATLRWVPVVDRSLLRSIPKTSLSGVLSRAAIGAPESVGINLHYRKRNYIDAGVNSDDDPSSDSIETELAPLDLVLAVDPGSRPPTNIHALIGRNGSGKSTLMKAICRSIITPNLDPGKNGEFLGDDIADQIANVVFVSFSAFDKLRLPARDISQGYACAYSYVGLHQPAENLEPDLGPRDNEMELPLTTVAAEDLNTVFAASAWNVVSRVSRELWRTALKGLESDTNFRMAEVSALADYRIDEPDSERTFRTAAEALFEHLSSGHKIVLLATTRLVETVTERTIVLLDEPEGHLHPPLLAAFIGVLSTLLRARNGLAVLATHSPVVLQEVPKTCVRTIERMDAVQTATELPLESYGENLGTLTSAVFGLEVEDSGFHALLRTLAVDENLTFPDALQALRGQLGMEGRAILRTIAQLASSQPA